MLFMDKGTHKTRVDSWKTTKVEAQRRTPTPEETQQSHVIQPIAVDHGSWTVGHDPGTNQDGSWIMINEQRSHSQW